MTDNTIDYKLAFEALPGSFIIIKPDAPLYTVLSVSDEILYLTARKRKDLVGKSIFEVCISGEPGAISGKWPVYFKKLLTKSYSDEGIG